MDTFTKSQIGRRLREKREQAGYTREKLAELCSLSPRFIANVEFGDSTFSLDSLMSVCRILSCSADYILFGVRADIEGWSDTVSRLCQLDLKYQAAVNKTLQGVIEAIVTAERERLS